MDSGVHYSVKGVPTADVGTDDTELPAHSVGSALPGEEAVTAEMFNPYAALIADQRGMSGLADLDLPTSSPVRRCGLFSVQKGS